MTDSQLHINEMARQLLNNNLTLFIGAGFSNIFGYPGWGELLKEISNEYNLYDRLKSTSLFPIINEESENTENLNTLILDNFIGVDYLKLAGYIHHILDNDKNISIHKAIVDTIKEYEESRIKNEEVQKIINFFQKWKESLGDIITTNYDTNIEYCLENEVNIINRNLDSLNNIKYKNKLFKIHGCLNDVDDQNNPGIIITEKDYNDFKNKNKYLFYRIYSLFTEKKVVFIGYSINDPNIRSLLNDVIEESDGKVGLQIYWISRDKLNNLDRAYYEENFKLRIIDEMEIADFFNSLELRIEKNQELLEVVNQSAEEYSKSFMKNYFDKSFLENVFDENRESDVLKYLYKRLIEEDDLQAIKPYFVLLSYSTPEIIQKNKLRVQNVLEMQNSLLYATIDLIEDDSSVKAFFEKNRLINIYIKSLIKFASGSNYFGGYARSIGCLLKTYQLFRDDIGNNLEDFMSALTYNISISCAETTKYLGYDWRGLGEVKQNINVLNKDDLLIVINKLIRPYYDHPRKLQLKYVINYSSLDDSEKSVMLNLKIYEKRIISTIENIILDILEDILVEQYDFELTRDSKYINKHKDIKIAYKRSYLSNSTINYTIFDELNSEYIGQVSQFYNDNRLRFEIDEKSAEIGAFEEFSVIKKHVKMKFEIKVQSYIQHKETVVSAEQ